MFIFIYSIVPSFGSANNYRVLPGYIPAGGDIGVLPEGTTTLAAEAACDATAACAGFTFDGPRKGPSPGAVYLKNATAAAGYLPDPNSTWTSFFKAVGPCDLLAAAGNPCVAAHSLVRGLYSDYAGPLYQVNRTTDGLTLDIGVLPDSGAVADAGAQDAFCGSACTVSRIDDQSPRGNHLYIAPREKSQGGFNSPVNASRFAISIAGQKAYGAYFTPGAGYRNVNTSVRGVAWLEPASVPCSNLLRALRNLNLTCALRNLSLGSNRGWRRTTKKKQYTLWWTAGITTVDGRSMVAARGAAITTSFSTYISLFFCFIVIFSCMDYGNAGREPGDYGDGSMEAVYWGSGATWSKGFGSGPWCGADLENGIYYGGNGTYYNPGNMPLH